MNRLLIKLTFAAITLFFAAIACEFSFSSAKLENVKLASDSDGNMPKTTFGQQDTIYLVGELVNSPDDTKLKTTWVVLEADRIAPNTVLDEVELTTGSGSFNFSLENENALWLPGKYRVDLYLDDELSQSFEYEIQQTVQAKIQDLSLSFDAEGDQSTTIFKPGDTFHLVGNLENSPGNSIVKVIWSAVDVQGDIAAGVIDQQEQVVGSGFFSFAFDTNLPAWPVGNYSVEVLLDEDFVQTIGFQVEEAAQIGAEEVRMAFDENGAQPTSVFSPQDKFFLAANIVNAPPEGVPVKVVWISRDVEGENSDNQEIEVYEGTAENGFFWASLTSNSGVWPVGEYNVELYLDDQLIELLAFEVTANEAEPSQGSTPVINNVYTAKDADGEQASDVYLPDETFYVLAELVNAPQGAQIEAVWKAEDVTGFGPSEVISEPKIFDFNEGMFSISLENTEGKWTAGKYAVDLILNDTIAASYQFLVSTTRIVDPYMAYDKDGNRKTASFGTSDPFYLMFTLENAPSDTKITTRWIQQGELVDDDILLNDSVYTFGSGQYYVELTSNTGSWSIGNYVVELYLNDYNYISVVFDVK